MSERCLGVPNVVGPNHHCPGCMGNLPDLEGSSRFSQNDRLTNADEIRRAVIAAGPQPISTTPITENFPNNPGLGLSPTPAIPLVPATPANPERTPAQAAAVLANMGVTPVVSPAEVPGVKPTIPAAKPATPAKPSPATPEHNH